MIIKSADDKQSAVTNLENLMQRPDLTGAQRQVIDKELKIMRAGIKGETESAYLIDFDFKASQNTAVIHDLRLEIGGRVAQIDHLLVHRTMNIYVLETKHFNSGMKITDDGEFLRWNDYKKTFEGMASPLEQNNRHIEVLKDAFATIDMPTRMGVRISPSFESFVLVSSSARIDRSKQFDSSRIIKADVLRKSMDKLFDNESILTTIGSMARFVAADTVKDIAEKLCRLHRPIEVNYLGKFGLNEVAVVMTTAITPAATPAPRPADTGTAEVSVSPESRPDTAHACRVCGSGDLIAQAGKFGYYFKCRPCGGNTPIKIDCGIAGHREKIRKDGSRFYRECVECKTSSIFHENGH